MLSELPAKVRVLDFDGELFFRGSEALRVLPHKDRLVSWLPEAEYILRSMAAMRVAVPVETAANGSGIWLSEVHLGRCAATAQDVADLLKAVPTLRLLRHYQMVAALCLLHNQDWRTQKLSLLPKYKLTNIDADFSHVVRCRMSPSSVLPVDAIRLAVSVCPEASDVRLRFDCSTPHDVAAPLLALNRLTRLSAVCVTSGERTLLDFTDLLPLLEKFGPKSLVSLELKVLEEVEAHAILRHCPRLEVLTLSGCGFVTPAACADFGCHGSSGSSGTVSRLPRPSTAKSPSTPLALPRLRLLFYADGDDFSWDHYLPQCFWRSVLSSGDRRNTSRLEGLFLESPRISVDTLEEVFREKCLPFLRVLSVCRTPEITMEHLVAAGPSAYMRISKCEQIKPRHATRIRHLTKIEVQHD